MNIFETFSTFLRLYGSSPMKNRKEEIFPDVPSTKHFAEAVNDFAQRNIIGRYPDGTFKPGNSITRGQAAAIIVKLTKLDTGNVKDPKFKDVTTANGFDSHQGV